MSIQEFAAGIQATSLSTSLKTATWVIPTMQSIHIIMVGVVFVSILAVALRVLGRFRADEPLAKVWGRFAPFLWVGVLLMAITGTLLTIAEPVREFMTLSFRLKLAMLVVCLASAAFFGRSMQRAARNPAAGLAPAPGAARVAAVVTLALWLFVIFLGRAIAYDKDIWGDWSPMQSLGGAVI